MIQLIKKFFRHLGYPYMKRYTSVIIFVLVIFFACTAAYAYDAGEVLTFSSDMYTDLRVEAPIVEAPVNEDSGRRLLSPKAVTDPYEDIKKQIVDEIVYYTAHPEEREIDDGFAYFEITNTSGGGITTSNLDSITRNAYRNYPEECIAVDIYNTISIYSPENHSYFTDGETIKMGVYFADDTVDVEAFTEAVDKACVEIFGSPDGHNNRLTKFEKVLLAHDWLVTNCFYDPYTANKNSQYTSPKGKVFNQVYYVIYTPYGVFMDGQAVCDGYARAFTVLMNRAGVDSCYVSSEDMNHSWNMVYIGGYWYHVDVTWNDSIDPDTKDFAGHVYRDDLLRSDSEISDYHYGWTTEFNLVCSRSYSMPSYVSSTQLPFFYDGSLIWGSDSSSCGYLRSFRPGWSLSQVYKTYYTSGISNLCGAAFDRRASKIYWIDYYGAIYKLDLKASSPQAVSFGQASGKKHGIAIREDETHDYAQVLYTSYAYDEVDVWSFISNDDGSASLMYFGYLPSLSNIGTGKYIVSVSGNYKVMIFYYADGKYLAGYKFFTSSAGITYHMSFRSEGADEAKIMVLSDSYSPYLPVLTLQ